jgi:hypothetical protein
VIGGVFVLLPFVFGGLLEGLKRGFAMSEMRLDEKMRLLFLALAVAFTIYCAAELIVVVS